ncbi:hypothetical protein D3C83_184260 [compost metagenome]
MRVGRMLIAVHVHEKEQHTADDKPDICRDAEMLERGQPAPQVDDAQDDDERCDLAKFHADIE